MREENRSWSAPVEVEQHLDVDRESGVAQPARHLIGLAAVDVVRVSVNQSSGDPDALPYSNGAAVSITGRLLALGLVWMGGSGWVGPPG
jgi:hypothetical protein